MQGTKFDAKNWDDSGWVYDGNGYLCRPDPIRGDTATGVVECVVCDHKGQLVIDFTTGEVVTVTRHFPPPLTIVPIVLGQEPPFEFLPADVPNVVTGGKDG